MANMVSNIPLTLRSHFPQIKLPNLIINHLSRKKVVIVEG